MYAYYSFDDGKIYYSGITSEEAIAALLKDYGVEFDPNNVECVESDKILVVNESSSYPDDTSVFLLGENNSQQ